LPCQSSKPDLLPGPMASTGLQPSALHSDPPSMPAAVMAVTVANLPDHLGWGSAALTAVLRHAVSSPAGEMATAVIPDEQYQLPPLTNTPAIAPDIGHDWVKLYPDIGLGMLRQEMEAAGRLWLLLRHLDGAGQGIVRIDRVFARLTSKSSDLYLCGKRQLRNLLRAGEGVYWTRDKTRVWLRSAARVAAELGVARLTGQPVALPLTALREGIGPFRAHLYTAFHSGRAKGARGVGMPVARETLANLSGVGANSQRAYEARVGLTTQANFAIGEAITKAEQEEQAWRHGRALFDLRDRKGQQGRAGKTYLAWQLPNSYVGQHPQRPKGRQKRINRQLQDLVMQGMPGNDGVRQARREPDSGPLRAAGKRYYPNGRAAGQSGHNSAAIRYWRRPETGNGRLVIWHPLEQA
jgi:hypothetical protein